MQSETFVRLTNLLMGFATTLLFLVSAVVCAIVGCDSLYRHWWGQAAFSLVMAVVLAVFTAAIWRDVKKRHARWGQWY